VFTKLYVHLIYYPTCIYFEHSILEYMVRWFYYIDLEFFLSDKQSDWWQHKTTQRNSIWPFIHSNCRYKIWL